MLRQTTNPAPQVTTAKVEPANMLRRVVQLGKVARTAALDLCYSSAGFILLVSHFLDAKDKNYMTRGDAVDYLREQITAQAGVKGDMLGIYIRNASTLAGILMGSSKMFSPTIQQIGLAESPEDIQTILSGWMNKNHDDRGLRRKIDSLAALSEALGFSVSKRQPAQRELTGESAIKQVTNLLNRVEDKVVGSGKGKVKESEIASTIIATVKSKVVFATEAIKAITETSELDAVDNVVKEHRKTLKRLSTEATASAKAAGKPKPGKTPSKSHRKGAEAVTLNA